MNHSYPNVLISLERSLKGAPNTKVTKLVQRLIAQAKLYDLQQLESLPLSDVYIDHGIKQDFQNPRYFDHKNLNGAPWADNQKSPLEDGEAWNKGRRTTLSKTFYEIDKRGYPINPYVDRGLDGRGLLGQFGPNYAVDNGAVKIVTNSQGKKRLSVTGIIRQDDGKPAFAGGFIESVKQADGSYAIDKNLIVETQVKEFFEEMVSGSIELLPEYQAHFEKLLEQDKQETGRERYLQILTEVKYEQVLSKDPSFFDRLREVIEQGVECYAGPVLNSERSTNNAWIETVLSWYLLDDERWNFIRGENPVFDYDLSAGDDAAGLVLHDINPTLIAQAAGSHGVMFVFLGASYMLNEQAQGRSVDPDIIAQFDEVLTYLKTSTLKHQKKQNYTY